MYPPLPLFTPPPRVTGPFSFQNGRRLSPSGALLFRRRTVPIGGPGNSYFSAKPGIPRTGKAKEPLPCSAAAPALFRGESFRPRMSQSGARFHHWPPPGGVSFRSGGNFFRLTVRLGFAACVELGMLFLLHPIQNGILLKIPYAGRNLQPVCSVRLHRLCRPAVFLWHT